MMVMNRSHWLTGIFNVQFFLFTSWLVTTATITNICNRNDVDRTSSMPMSVLRLKWIRVRDFDPEYCSSAVVYYHQMNVEMRVKAS